jgi:hypothetical protein
MIQLDNILYFKYLGSIKTNEARCTRQIKSRIAVEKSELNKNQTFHQQIGLILEEETSEVLNLEHNFVWC